MKLKINRFLERQIMLTLPLQFQIMVPQLINFGIFCRTPPSHINFPDFAFQIFQKFQIRDI